MTGTGPRRTSSSDESRPLLSHHDTEELLTARYHYGTNNGTDLNNNAAVIGGQNNDNVDGNNRDGDDDGLDDFNFDDSPDNPQNWPTPFKWSVVALLAMTAFSVPLLPPGAPSSSSGGISQKSASVLLVTIWELGEAAGPLLIAPLSELFGRYPTLNISNILLIFFTILTATATSIPTLILARCLTGLAVASNVLNPAIVGDMFPSDQRGSPMSMIFVAPLVGGALGPAIASAVAESVGWRNVVWGAAGLSTACEVLFLCLFKETYKVAIIKRRLKEKTRLADQANALLGGGGGGRRQRGHKRSYSEMSIGSKRDAWRKLRDSVLRPFLVVFGSGLLMALSLLGSVTFSFFYVISVTLPEILDGYGLEGGVKGLCFMGFTVGSFVAVLICNAFLDRIYIALRDRDLALTQPCSPDDCIPKEKPEYRLPLTIIGAFSMPFAISFYGWVAHLSLPLPFLLIACALIGANAMLTLIPLMAYVVDAFGLFSASAMTGVIVSRCLMGTFLPLTTAPLVDAFGYGWGFMVFGAVSMALAPISVVVFRYGERWRSFCKYSRAE
ncbi:major facilitator superfamily domain-containing protein [Sordaria brevicollis]|uniref:Major facilitator superfamily domain-containing protein n=1 Tax=Sordaria brevicollis TaxID=83679 RepID=A0AAE0UET1_SORBR|nr:major facilitator superfamily domain-containing protein [Sordaria brevicollis]